MNKIKKKNYIKDFSYSFGGFIPIRYIAQILYKFGGDFKQRVSVPE